VVSGPGPLLPTPQAHDARGAKTPAQVAAAKARTQAGFSNLNEVVENELAALVPTVTAGGYRSYAFGTRPSVHSPEKLFPGGAWGQYAGAVARHEAMLGRPAPCPMEPGKTGRPRLSAGFAEWMMCLPEGWVTAPEIGLSRSAAVHALGNGVVPPQAAHAVRGLLEVRDFALGKGAGMGERLGAAA
jgi:hypothetical protein